MRLYVTEKGRWAGTQADANALLKEHGDKGWEQVEVPTDKPGLLSFLDVHRVNAMCDSALAMVEPERPAIPLAPDSKPETVERFARDREASEIEDFILNRATVAQVERLFAAMGTRFAEARK